MLTTTQLAKELGVSVGRVSQLVAAGKLDGCFHGDGRQRRFDPARSAQALTARLDPGQMMGNGAATRAKMRVMADGDIQAPVNTAPPPKSDGPLSDADTDRYTLARAQITEEQARKLRRQNLQEEGTLVLASEVERTVARAMQQELAEFENVLREGARAVADKMGVDFREVRKIMIDVWRQHRGARAADLEATAINTDLSPTEQAQNF
jgi:excisionase family DNA binding protein